jgi:hypothetical protein
MASIATVVTMGFGSFGSVNLVPTLGFGVGAVLESTTPVFRYRDATSGTFRSRDAASSTAVRYRDQASTSFRPR